MCQIVVFLLCFCFFFVKNTDLRLVFAVVFLWREISEASSVN